MRRGDAAVDGAGDAAVDAVMTGSQGRWAGAGWLLLALALYLAQSLPLLSHRWVTDESWYTGPGYSLAHGGGLADPAIGPNDMENHFDARPPGTALTIAFFLKLLGTGQAAARTGSILAGLAAIVLLFLLAREFFDPPAAAMTALLLGSDNFLVLASRTARPEAFTTMAVVASLLAMARFRCGSAFWAFLSGILIAAGALFHVTVLGYMLSLGILSVVVGWGKPGRRWAGTAAFVAGVAAGLLPFVVWIAASPLGPQAFHIEYLSRALGEPLSQKLADEAFRYRSFLGLDELHFLGLERLPARLPIVLLLLAATWLLFRYRRRWFFLELLLLAPTMLWFVDTANKSSRYMANLSPVFALVIGGAIAASAARHNLRKLLLVTASLAVIAQIGANFILLRAARKADYTALADKLRAVVPPGETVYGTITFWLAFHDHPYISYERTDPQMAATDFHARYFIAGDRMMTQREPGDTAFYRTLNEHFNQVVANATVVGRFPDPYYGDLVVYRLNR